MIGGFAALYVLDCTVSIHADGACRFAKLDRFVMGQSKDITGKEEEFDGNYSTTNDLSIMEYSMLLSTFPRVKFNCSSGGGFFINSRQTRYALVVSLSRTSCVRLQYVLTTALSKELQIQSKRPVGWFVASESFLMTP